MPRPEYTGNSEMTDGVGLKEEEAEGSGGRSGKKNFEETSDEEE